MFIASIKEKLKGTVDWHYYVYSFLAAVLAVCVAIQSNVFQLPPNLVGIQFYAAIIVVFLTAFLPRIQTSTGPGAPPILSPPKEDSIDPKV